MKKLVEESLFEYMSWEKTKKMEYPVQERIKELVKEYDKSEMDVYASTYAGENYKKYVGTLSIYISPYTNTVERSKEETEKRNKEYNKLLKKQKAEDITGMSNPEASIELRIGLILRIGNEEVLSIDFGRLSFWKEKYKDIKLDQEGIQTIEKVITILAPYGNLSDNEVDKLLSKLETTCVLEPEKVIAESLVNEEVFKSEKEIGLEPADVDAKEFLVGIAVEKEHSDNLAVCKTIAMQHLSENPKYYSEGMKKGIFDEPAAINIYKKYFIDKKEPEEADLAI